MEILRLTNHGLKNLPQEIVFQELEKLAQLSRSTGFPIVSIGSGKGYLEKFIKDTFQVPIICVDPDPESWNNHIHIVFPPDFETAQKLLEKHPEMAGKCILLFNWCFPNNECDSYDIRALTDLDPVAFLSIYESVGGAHSSEFHNFLGQMQPPAPFETSDSTTVRYVPCKYGCEYYHENDQTTRILCIARCKKLDILAHGEYVPFDVQEMKRKHLAIVIASSKDCSIC
jgi:hypothetical protein